MSLPRVFIPHPIHADGIARLEGQFVVEAPLRQDDEAQRQSFVDADAVIVRNIGIDARLMDACPRLRVIAKHGAGVDNIDIPAATARGIVVASVPGGNADAVAEATVAMMLAALRRVPEVHRLRRRRALFGALGAAIRAASRPHARACRHRQYRRARRENLRRRIPDAGARLRSGAVGGGGQGARRGEGRRPRRRSSPRRMRSRCICR